MALPAMAGGRACGGAGAAGRSAGKHPEAEGQTRCDSFNLDAAPSMRTLDLNPASPASAYAGEKEGKAKETQRRERCGRA